METTILESTNYTTIAHIKRFVDQFYKKGALGPIKSEYERGYYTSIIHTLEASPQLWLLMDDKTRKAIDDVKRQIDLHYGLTDPNWPPKNIRV